MPSFACRRSGEYLDPFINRPHGPDVKLPLTNRVDNFFSQHQVFHARRRDDDPLLAI
jgi:hypothetical protein